MTSAPDGAHDKRWKRLEMDVAVSKALHRPATPPSAQIFTFSLLQWLQQSCHGMLTLCKHNLAEVHKRLAPSAGSDTKRGLGGSRA